MKKNWRIIELKAKREPSFLFLWSLLQVNEIVGPTNIWLKVCKSNGNQNLPLRAIETNVNHGVDSLANSQVSFLFLPLSFAAQIRSFRLRHDSSRRPNRRCWRRRKFPRPPLMVQKFIFLNLFFYFSWSMIIGIYKKTPKLFNFCRYFSLIFISYFLITSMY